MANNNSTIWARPSVIVALSGLSDRRVRRDIMRYHVSSKKRRESPLRYYDLSAFEKILGYQFTKAQIEVVVNRLTRPVVLEDL